MDKESIYLLQKIDCNCNDCAFMQRDFKKYKKYDDAYKDESGKVTHPSHRPQYGDCIKLNKPIAFLPNTFQIDTQQCFVHRKDIVKAT